MFSIFAVVETAISIPYMISNGETWQLGVFLVIPLLLLYNGEKGSGKAIHKWVFYIFYPLHLFILGLIKVLVG